MEPLALTVAMPVGEALGGELGDFGVAQGPKNVLARDALDGIAGLAAAAPIVLEIVCHCASHRVGSSGCQRAETAGESLLLQAPIARRALRLRKVEDAVAVGVLEIVSQAKLGLAVDTALVATACDPGAAGFAPAIAEMQSLLDDTPVRFGVDRKPQARAARRQARLADGPRHAKVPPMPEKFCLLFVYYP